ncbi:MAG: HPP family protein, partial [Bacteroides sp.]
MERKKRIKYLVSILMILFMIGVAEWTGEKEIIFPEMAALTIGLWIVDKRVWRVKRSAIVWLMT